MQDFSGDKVCRVGGEEDGEDGQYIFRVYDIEVDLYYIEVSLYRIEGSSYFIEISLRFFEVENGYDNFLYVNRV